VVLEAAGRGTQPRALHGGDRDAHRRAGGLQADLRASESRLETLRSDHYAAGDALHERQGEFYAANAEVTRLEQNSRSRARARRDCRRSSRD